jgi:hypothetical protein
MDNFSICLPRTVMRQSFITYPNFSISHITTVCSKVLHPIKSQLPQVSVLDSGGDQGHRNISVTLQNQHHKRASCKNKLSHLCTR